MTRDQMLTEISEQGEDSGSDLHDGLDGWFGWSISSDNILTAHWSPSRIEGEGHGPTETASWRLQAIATDSAAAA